MLREYKRKRDFKITPEPTGAEVPGDKQKRAKSLTFVIQKHAARRLHYDFRLEVDGVMVSWAVPKGPSLNPADKRLAVMTEDHPMEYSSFEGIIPEKQYGAGEVIIWDHGIYSPDENEVYSWSDKNDANERMRNGIKKGKLSFYLKGDKLEGSWTLVKLHNQEKEWLLIKHHDKFEDATIDITEQNQSVVSGQTLEDLQANGADRIWTSGGAKSVDKERSIDKRTSIDRATSIDKTTSVDKKTSEQKETAKESRPSVSLANAGRKAAYPVEISPMLATLADGPFEKPGWFFEPKLDGIRAIAYLRRGKCHLLSRNQNDLTEKYPSIVDGLKGYDEDMVFDGEIVALDEKGRPSFQYLQQSGTGLKSFKGSKKGELPPALIYYVFDILYAAGRDLTGLTTVERKNLLQSILNTNESVRYVQSLGSDGLAVYSACAQMGLEGVVGKREDSTYELGRRSRSWLKVKASMSSEFLICGFTEGTGSRNHTFGSLILGEYDDKGILQYVGGVGTGFDQKKLAALLKTMNPLITKQCPFKKKPAGKLNPTWVKPELVVEVKYMERTQENILRAPVYLHLREDIEPDKVKEPAVVHVESKNGKKIVSINKGKEKDGSGAAKGKEGVAVAKGREDVGVAKGKEDVSPAKRNEGVSAASERETQNVLEQLDTEKEKLNLEVEGHIIPLSSLNKVFWPEHDGKPAYTKRDYLRYLATVAPYVVPHLTDRLITLVRFPNGIHAARFYQKHWEHGLPKFLNTVSVFTEHEGRDQDFLMCNNLPTLLWLGQIADLELHTSHTRIDPEPDATALPQKTTGSVAELERSLMNYPDYLVLDLDPYLYSGKEKKGEEPELHRQGFRNCCDIALYFKKHLDELKLEAFLKTSGKTGLHIYVPITRNIDYDTVRSLAEILCRQILKEHPDKVTMDWAVIKRTGKIFMDHNMNARSKSLASIYSPRVAPEASVSTPIDWNELEKIYPTDFDMRTLPARLAKRGDLWRDILDHKCDLKTAFSQKKK
jgi:bifunctional non-homologous end joining protein LigD